MIPVRPALCKVAFIRAQHYEEEEDSVDNLASFWLLGTPSCALANGCPIRADPICERVALLLLIQGITAFP